MRELVLVHPETAVRRNGAVSFVGHLCIGLQRAGLPYRLLRIGKEDAKQRTKQFAGFPSVTYETAAPSELIRLIKNGPTLLVSNEHDHVMKPACFMSEMLDAGARVVVHGSHECDPNNRRSFAHLTNATVNRPTVIRKPVRAFFNDAVFLPHPYVRRFSGWVGNDAARREHACSISRVFHDKRPRLLLDANRLLPKRLHIGIYGEEHRLYTYGLAKQYPEFKQGTPKFPPGTGTEIAARHRFLVDMTKINGDGGGSQYTFMEGWDAGCVVVLHRDWLTRDGEMQDGVNCLSVASSEELAKLLSLAEESRGLQKTMRRISQNGVADLERLHDPVKVARKYYREMMK